MAVNGHYRPRLQDVTLRVSSSLQGKVKVLYKANHKLIGLAAVLSIIKREPDKPLGVISVWSELLGQVLQLPQHDKSSCTKMQSVTDAAAARIFRHFFRHEWYPFWTVSSGPSGL